MRGAAGNWDEYIPEQHAERTGESMVPVSGDGVVHVIVQEY